MSVGVIARCTRAAPAGKVLSRDGVGGRFRVARSDFLGFSVRPCAPRLSQHLCTAVHPPCGGSHHRTAPLPMVHHRTTAPHHLNEPPMNHR
jgi:hypothetical protein